jgi:hypothetical protein
VDLNAFGVLNAKDGRNGLGEVLSFSTSKSMVDLQKQGCCLLVLAQ